MSPTRLLDPERLARADTLASQVPFPFLVAHAQLPDTLRDTLADDFPAYRSAGFFPHEADDCGPAINALVHALLDPVLVAALGERLGLPDLARHPALVTLCRSVNKWHGTIHTDSRSKVATALLYLNPAWPDTSAGCLRFLYRDDSIEALVAPEIKPLYGTLVAFRRADNSFHGYLPFEGECRIVQVAWLRDEADLRRKVQRGLASRFLKGLAGGLDRRLGAHRSADAAHRDRVSGR